METHTFNGVLYDVVPAPFSMSINKCTGCALHATRYNKRHSAGCPLEVCAASLNASFSDKILTNPRSPHGN